MTHEPPTNRPDEGTFKVIAKGWDEQDFHEKYVPIIEAMTRDRGWIVSSYAQLEFLAADLIVKCRKFDDYADLNSQPLPFGIDNRIKRIRALCAAGPLSPYADQILPLMDHLIVLEETRHFFTHGFSSVHITTDGSRMGLHIRRYVPPEKGKSETKAEIFILPDEMSGAKTRWTIFAQTSVEIIRRVYDALGLEAHDVTAGSPTRMK